MSDLPFVLIIDDDPTQESYATLLSKSGVEAKHVLPDDISEFDLDRADLIVVDEFIEKWAARDSLANLPGLFVRDGIALAAVLRGHLEQRGPGANRPTVPSRTALVLRTGNLDSIASEIPKAMRAMGVAGRHDLEWVAEKSGGVDLHLADIARAAASLPVYWNPSSPEPQVAWLALADREWRDLALNQIEQCRPPWSTLSQTSAGRRWLTWFLQRILPFPTFLVDDGFAASYLGLKAGALDQLLGGETELAVWLAQSLYEGQLSQFAGRRWWRAGIAHLRSYVLETADGRLASDVATRIEAIQGTPMEKLGLSRPVFTIDESYAIQPDPVEFVDAVRLQPDGWPAFADDPWLLSSEVQYNPDLRELIVIDDRLDSGDGSQAE